MIKKIIPIKGMHCRSCELLVSERLKEIRGVKKVVVSLKRKNATILLDKPVSTELLKQTIFDAGYEIGIEDKKPFFSRNADDYADAIFSFIIVLVIYKVMSQLGITSINTGSGNPSSLLVVLLIGLTAGISTCMALVGGLVLGISARHSEKHPEATTAQKFRPHLFFNIGRILSYSILGGLIGLIGKAFQLNTFTIGTLTIIVGLVMLGLGLQLTELFPRISSGHFSLPASLSKILGIKQKHEKEYSHVNSAVIGALTFFLPCGFTQAMQLYAISTGSFVSGALIMGIFAIGTAPGLLGIGGLTALIKGGFGKKFFKFAGVVVISLAIFNINNGVNLTGVTLFSSSSKNASAEDPSVKIVDGVQEVRMTQTSSGYKPNRFTVQKDIPVKWIIDSKSSGSCSSSIFMNKYSIRKVLKSGENIIEFTPKDTGEVKFSCSMGMYSGTFNIVEKKIATTVGSTPTSSPTPSPSPTQTSTALPSKTSSDSQQVSSSSAEVSESKKQENDLQIIKAVYKSAREDISPTSFKVKSFQKVRFEITSLEDGRGCMSTIMIPGLVDEPQILEKNKTVVLEFTPELKETYQITCAMGVPRGSLIVE